MRLSPPGEVGRPGPISVMLTPHSLMARHRVETVVATRSKPPTELRAATRQEGIVTSHSIRATPQSIALKANSRSTMKALTYHGPGERVWEDQPKPTIKNATDAIVRISTTTICGTDLHIMKGDVPSVTEGRILGHEGVGIVEEVGSAVSLFKKKRYGPHLLHQLLCEMRLLQEGTLLSLP
jgi:hypothetical protein